MKPIKEKGYEHYLISKDGKVYNTLQTGFGGKRLRKEPKELKSHPNKNTAYMTVVLRRDNTHKCVYVHRLVASVYLPNPLNLPEVNHKNFIRSDNNVSNLEWVTKKQNAEHSYSKFTEGSRSQLSDNIKNDKTLLEAGINAYIMYGNLKSAAAAWNCSTVFARRILIDNSIGIYKKNTIPVFIKNELLELSKSNPKLKHRHIVSYTEIKYGITLTRHMTSSIIARRESLFTISKK